MFRKHLLSTVAVFAPPTEQGAPGPDDNEEQIDVGLDDDGDDQNPDQNDEGESADDDADDDQDDAAGAAGGDPPAAGRGDRAVGALRADRRRLAAENALLTRQLEEARRAPVHAPQQQQQVETAAQRAERMALMSPEERTEAIVTEALERNNRNTQALTNQMLDQSDKTAFDTRCLSNPLFKKLAVEVETRLQDLRSKGQNLPRETVATYLVGERAVAQLGKGKPGAQQRRRAQETKPNNGRGDVAADRAGRRGSGDTVRDMEARFGDVPI